MKTKIRSTDSCAEAIARIAELERGLGLIQSELDENISLNKREAEANAQPIEIRRAELAAAVEPYCVKNRTALTGGGTQKFAEFTTGKAGWRKGQPQLEVTPKRLDAIIAELRKVKSDSDRFLRIKTTLDAKALIKEPGRVKAISGAKIVPAKENFWIEPVALGLAGAPPEGG